MWLTVITNRAKWFLWAEQAVGTRKGLNNIFVSHQLIEIQRIYPFGIEPSQHLVDNDKQIDLLLWRPFNTHINLFMGKSKRHVFLEFLVRRYRKFLVVTLIIIFQHFNDSIFLERCAFVIVYILVEQRRNFQLRSLCFKKPIILNRFGDAAGRKDCVELTSTA